MSIFESLRTEQADRRRVWRRGRHTYYFEEDLAPCGVTGLKPDWLKELHGFDQNPKAFNLDDCLVSRPRPWILVIWEPLRTKAPGPHLAQPHCCYLNTVIFYAAPYYVRPSGRPYKIGGKWGFEKRPGFEEWGRTETRLRWDDVVEFQGEKFEIGGGTVRWANKRWWMCRSARRRA